MFNSGHRTFMQQALSQAGKARAAGEVPVGAVVVVDGEVVAAAHNEKEARRDPTAHAEILALREAAARLGRWRLPDADVYVTVEPCPMCMGAMLQARVRRVVFGAADPKAGAAGSVINLSANPEMNHRIEVIGGVMEEECREAMQEFFKERRRE